jgi:hypothetical protein
MDGKRSAGVVTLLVFFLAGCSTVENRIQSNPQVYGLLTPADQLLIRQGRIREGLPKAAVYLAWGSPDRIRSGVRLDQTFEAWTYTTLRSEFVPYPAYNGFGYFRGGLWRQNHFFYSFGPYPYSFDPYPGVVSYEVPYKTVFFEGGRCTGWEYLRY